MLTITESEYRRQSPDFRGIWTTERDDLPQWDLIGIYILDCQNRLTQGIIEA